MTRTMPNRAANMIRSSIAFLSWLVAVGPGVRDNGSPHRRTEAVRVVA